MSSPKKGQLDKLAEGVAMGYTMDRAAIEAGYAPSTTSMHKWLSKEPFKKLIEKHRAERDQAWRPDLAPIIDRLVKAADLAMVPRKDGEPPSGVALQAARGLLAEAARLKRLLPKDTPVAQPPAFEMTRAEWLATFAPKPAEPVETP